MNTQLFACLINGLITEDQIVASALDPTESSVLQSIRNGHTLLDLKAILDYVTFTELVAQSDLIGELSTLTQKETVVRILDQHRKTAIKVSLQRTMQKASIYLSQDNIDDAYAELTNLNIAAPDLELLHTKEQMQLAMQETSGYLTGIKAIDDRGGWLLGNMVGIIGDSGTMKTMLSLYLCVEILRNNPTFTCLYFEKEMPVKDIARRLIAAMTGTSISKIITVANSGTEAEIQTIVDNIDQVYSADPQVRSILDRLYIVGPDKFANAVDISILVKQYEPTVWCLDFLTMLEADDQDGYAFYKQQMDILKNLTTSTNSTSIILAQIKQNALQDRANKVPVVADAEFGSKLKQYSAYVYAAFYPRVYYTDNYVPDSYFYMVGLKNRHDIPMTIPLIASPHLAKFTEAHGQIKDQMNKWYNGYSTKK